MDETQRVIDSDLFKLVLFTIVPFLSSVRIFPSGSSHPVKLPLTSNRGLFGVNPTSYSAT